MRLALGFGGELRRVAEIAEFEQYSGRNNLELRNRDYVGKVMVRGFLFTKIRGDPIAGGRRDGRRFGMRRPLV